MSQQLQGAHGASLNFVSGLLAVATSTGLFKTVTNTLTYSIGGFLYTKAPTDNIPFTIEPNSGINPTAPNSFQTVAVGDSAGFSIFIDSAGTVTVAPGSSGPAGQEANFPAAPANKALIVSFKATPAATYTPGTTALTSVSTFYNLACHPGATI